MPETTANYKRYRFNVPFADTSTLQWCEQQVSLSTSLRQLIRAEIERNGYVDAMCVPVQQMPKPGRPLGAQNKKTIESNKALEEQSEVDETVVVTEPAPQETVTKLPVQQISQPKPVETYAPQSAPVPKTEVKKPIPQQKDTSAKPVQTPSAVMASTLLDDTSIAVDTNKMLSSMMQ